MKLFKLLIIPLLLTFGYLIFLSLPYFSSKINRFDSLGMLSVIEEKQINIQKTLSPQRTTDQFDNHLLKGEKLMGQLTASENNFGILLFRFNQLASKVSDRVIFKIKEKGKDSWYYENIYKANQFQNNEYFAFGFPSIQNSKNNEYFLEIESLAGVNTNGVMISSRKSQVALVYKYSLHDLINANTLFSFLSKKVVYATNNINFLQNWNLIFIFILSLLLTFFLQNKKVTASYIIRFFIYLKKIHRKILKIMKSNYISFYTSSNIFSSFLILRINLKKKIYNFHIKNKFVLLFFIVLVFIAYWQLLYSYFEADEWYAFTLTLPLTSDPLGFLKILVKSTVDAKVHIVPISIELFFLNTLFFGTNFVPYAFISVFLHSINSFLVFFFMRLLMPRKLIFAFLGGIFFALAPTPMHAVTWAATYQTSVLPVTLSLLSIIFLKFAFLKEKKKFIWMSIIFLFLALLTKEIAFFLFITLPVMVIFEKRVFPLKFLGKVFAISLIVYLIFRFIIPNLDTLSGKIVGIIADKNISKSYTQPINPVDTGTIVSRDLSIYKNLPAEVISRVIIFPVRMVGTVFVSRPTVFSIVGFITPIAYPSSSEGNPGQLGFLYGSGNFVVIYIISIAILIYSFNLFLKFKRERQLNELQALMIGYSIVIVSALLLVLIIFTFPRWGTDFYFDSRYYYPASIGAAIIFPFLLFGLGEVISRLFRIKNISFVVLGIFIIWLINNMYVFNITKSQFINRYGADRKEIVSQLKDYIPILKQKTVFYMETDGLSAFGPSLPFYTSVPQALTVEYYDKNHLPDSFFNKTLFDGKPQGYSYMQGRGLGYYTSKKDLAEAFLQKKFELSDIHAFYYKSLEGKLLDKTLEVRKEMQDYLSKTDILDWKKFNDTSSGIKFLYPASTKIEELRTADASTIKSLLLKDPQFNAEISFVNVSPTFNIVDSISFLNQKNGTPLTLQDISEKNVYFDKYHFNKLTATNENQPRYFMSLNGILLYIKAENSSLEGIKLVERILGSLEIIDEK